MARNRTRAERRAAKHKAAIAAVDIVLSDESLRSFLGLMLWRVWLFKGRMTKTDADYRGRQIYEYEARKWSDGYTVIY